MRKKIIINDVCFNTQEDAKNHTRKVLVELEPKRHIRPGDEGWAYLDALIRRHPEYESKKGAGIRSVIIKRDYNRNIAIELKQVDGTIQDISWIYCVKGQAASPKQNLLSAMRFAVIDQIANFRRSVQSFPHDCKICFKPILTPRDMHIHHEPQFEDLAEIFIGENSPYPIQFDDDPATNQAKFADVDSAYSKHWQAYHRQHAILMAVHAQCNLTQKKT